MNKRLTTTAIGSALALAIASASVSAEPYEASGQPESSAATQSAQPYASESSEASQMKEMNGGTLQSVVEQNAELSTFVEAVQAAGMEQALTGGTGYTVFAPTNDAFAASGAGESLTESANLQQLTSVLRAHIVADDVAPEMAEEIGAAKTVDGGQLEIVSDGEYLKVNEAQVVADSIQVGSLRIYPIDQVLEAQTSSDVAATSPTATPSSSSDTMTSDEADEEEAEE